MVCLNVNLLGTRRRGARGPMWISRGAFPTASRRQIATTASPILRPKRGSRLTGHSGLSK